MKISDALKGRQRIYIDTAPLIYYVEAHSKYGLRMHDLIKAVEAKRIQTYYLN